MLLALLVVSCRIVQTDVIALHVLAGKRLQPPFPFVQTSFLHIVVRREKKHEKKKEEKMYYSTYSSDVRHLTASDTGRDSR